MVLKKWQRVVGLKSSSIKGFTGFFVALPVGEVVTLGELKNDGGE